MSEPAERPRQPAFRDELEDLISSHSMENTSDTPDYVLASFLTACLAAFDGATVERDRWHGFRETASLGAGPLKKWEERT